MVDGLGASKADKQLVSVARMEQMATVPTDCIVESTGGCIGPANYLK